MSTPKLFPAKPNVTKSVPPHRSMLPLPKPTLPCPPQEHRTKHKQMSKITESKSELKKPSQRPVTAPTATPSLALPRAASATLVETRARARRQHRPPVLSYNQLSQDNQRLQGELLSLRSALQQTGTQRREEHGAMSSEVTHLTFRLSEADSAVSQLTSEASSHREQTRKLLSLLEGKGIDPLSGEEVLTREQRMSASRSAAERARTIAEYLDRQSARHTEIQTALREQREGVLSLLSGNIVDTRFPAASPVPTIGELSHS